MMRNGTRRVQATLLMSVVAATLGAQVPDRDVVRSRIAAHLAEGQVAEALAVYDAHTGVDTSPDVELLGMIARAELHRQVNESSPVQRAQVLEILARGDDAEALKALRAAAGAALPADAAPSQEALAPTISLARLGDEAAATRLGVLLGTATPDLRVQIIRALREADARSQASRIAALLDDPLPQVQIAAVLATGALQYRPAIPRLEALFGGGQSTLRLVAAIALKRLGVSSADAFVAKLLASGVPEVRLMAAEAFPSADIDQRKEGTRDPRRHWTDSLRELLDDRNEMVRLKAAEVLACCDVPAARAVLTGALRDSPVPPMRAEAARILAATDLSDAALARQMLGDEAGQVRIHGAAAALRLAQRARR